VNAHEARLLVGTTNGLALFARSFATVVGTVVVAMLTVAFLGQTHVNAKDGTALLLLLGCAAVAALLGSQEQARRLRLMAALKDPPDVFS
jgi:hypothetical protein